MARSRDIVNGPGEARRFARSVAVAVLASRSRVERLRSRPMDCSMDRTSAPHRRQDSGFTLVEILIVVVIIGLLSTVAVFAVGDITGRSRDSAAAADQKILERAQEAYRSENGVYAAEADLVSGGLLREESATWDISLATDGLSYTLVAQG